MLWPWPLTLILKQGNSDVKTRFFALVHHFLYVWVDVPKFISGEWLDIWPSNLVRAWSWITLRSTREVKVKGQGHQVKKRDFHVRSHFQSKAHSNNWWAYFNVKLHFLAFDLDLWPTILTCNPNLAKVKVNLHIKYQGHRQTVQPWERTQADRWMDGQTDGLLKGKLLCQSRVLAHLYKLHGGLIYITFCLSSVVCLSGLDKKSSQKVVDNNSYLREYYS